MAKEKVVKEIKSMTVRTLEDLCTVVNLNVDACQRDVGVLGRQVKRLGKVNRKLRLLSVMTIAYAVFNEWMTIAYVLFNEWEKLKYNAKISGLEDRLKALEGDNEV